MIPSVLAFALSGVYTIVDVLFIGRSLGDISLAAIALGLPIAAFVQSVGTRIGLAGGIHYMIFGAQNNERKQQNCFSGAAWLLLLLSVLLTAVFFFFAELLLRLLGAKGEVLAMAAEYVRVIALGAWLLLAAVCSAMPAQLRPDRGKHGQYDGRVRVHFPLSEHSALLFFVYAVYFGAERENRADSAQAAISAPASAL